MKIAYLEDSPVPAPAAYSVHTLATVAAMGELGHEVTLYAPGHAGRVRGEADLAAVRREQSLRGPFRLRYLPLPRRLPHIYMAIAALFARGSDLAYVRNPRVADFAVRAGNRVLLETHDAPITERTRAHYRRLAKSDRVARWVFVSERLRELMARDIPFPPERAVVAHNGVALDLYKNLPSREQARRALGLRVEGPMVVHSGHMYAGRGIELLLEVAATRPSLLVVLVGGRADDIARVEADIARRKLENVRIVGHRPVVEVPMYLAAADVLALPYTSNAVTLDGTTKHSQFGSPMKTFEYLASGRPIVATRFPSIAEVLRDGDTALLVDPDRAAALGAGIDALLADPSRAQAMGERARHDAEKRTWVERTRRVLEGLGSGR